MNAGSDELPLEEFLIQNGMRDEVEAHWPRVAARSSTAAEEFAIDRIEGNIPNRDDQLEDLSVKPPSFGILSVAIPDAAPAGDSDLSTIASLRHQVKVFEEKERVLAGLTSGWAKERDQLRLECGDLRLQIDKLLKERDDIHRKSTLHREHLTKEHEKVMEILHTHRSRNRKLKKRLEVYKTQDTQIQLQSLTQRNENLVEELTKEKKLNATRQVLNAALMNKLDEAQAEKAEAEEKCTSLRDDMVGLVRGMAERLKQG